MEEITVKDVDISDKLNSLQLELDKVKNESSEYWDLFLRCKAEMENIKKRTDREIINISNYSLQNILTDLIPVLDGFELCLNSKFFDNKSDSEGISLIYKMLINVLLKYNFRKMSVNENDIFDNLKHEVVSVVHDVESINNNENIIDVSDNCSIINDGNIVVNDNTFDCNNDVDLNKVSYTHNFDNVIKSVIQNGYVLNDRVLRYAKVSVVKKNKGV